MAELAINGGSKEATLHAPNWPQVGEEEIEAVVAALRKSKEDGSYLCSAAGGGPTEEFEKQFADFMGGEYATCTCGGGPALHIAVMAAGVEAGDEVIVSPYTWGQTVSCILQQNAIPIYADIDPKTYTLDAESVEAKISPYTKAIVVVHIYGHPADMDPIMEVARKHGLQVIEDCAQATGALYKGRRVGTIGDFGCFSIGDGKQMIGGEGGLLLTNEERSYELANVFGQHPSRQHKTVKDPDLRHYIDSLIYTYRIHPVAPVIAGVQLKYLDKWNSERRANHGLLSKGLEEVPGIEPVYVSPDCEHVYHQYSPSFVSEEVEGVSKRTYVRALAAEGVPIGTGYVGAPIHLRPRMQDKKYFFGKGYPWTCAQREIVYRAGDCPVAEDRCARTELSIGGGPRWLGDQSELVKQILRAFHKVTDNLEALRKLERSVDT